MLSILCDSDIRPYLPTAGRDSRHQTEGEEMARDYTKEFIKKFEYLAPNRYEELWTKAQERLRRLQGLISYIEKSGV